MHTDEVRRIAHDPEAIENFYRLHVEAILGFVSRRVRDPHVAADLTADVFLAAMESASTFDPRRGEARGWLFGIARNVVHTEYRRVARDQQMHERIAGRRLLDDDDIERLQERIDAESVSRALLDDIARLPQSERAVLELVAVDQLTVTEAAAALGIRAVTARVRLHRARSSLRAGTNTRTAHLGPATPVAAPLTPTLEAS
jgi:RNA polymerase sigma-70 factor (ECF subfamily)